VNDDFYFLDVQDLDKSKIGYKVSEASWGEFER